MAAKEQPRLEAVQTKEFVVTALAMNQLQMHDHANMRWRASLKPGTPPEALEDPQLYSVVSNRLRPYDIVEFVTESFWAEVLVVAAEKSFPVVVKTLRVVEFTTLPKNEHSDLPVGYGISYDPTTHRYTPVRNSDGHPMAESQPTRELARTRLVEHAAFR